MRGGLAILRKELLVLSRDLHGLLVLFAMPLAFILIMSLAMQDEYASRAETAVEVWVVDGDGGPRARRWVETLGASGAYRLVESPAGTDLADLRERLMGDDGQFLLHIPPGFFERFGGGLSADADPEAGGGPPLEIVAAPSVRRPMVLLLEGAVKEAVARVRLDDLLRDVRAELGDPDALTRRDDDVAESPVPDDAIALTHLFRGEERRIAPSAVQQNVPAWLVFSMFFVAIPLSNTFVREREHGTLARLRGMDVSASLLVFGKLVPYALVNQVQAAGMLAVGVWLVPLLGGETLRLGGSPAGLILMTGAVSLAALGFALLVAALARTTEQATVIGGAGSILLGAIGGIMVPRFLMPAPMQSLSQVSPMSWGLEGFLDVLLRQGGVREVLAEAGALVVFGGVALLAAIWLLRRRAD